MERTSPKRCLDENAIARELVDAAVSIHSELGPGLLESVYEAVLCRELSARGIVVDRQAPIPIEYKGMRFDQGFRADLVLNDSVIVELKSVEEIAPVHLKQLLTYLRLKPARLGLVLNFNSDLMKNGIRRVVNGMPDNAFGRSTPLKS